MFGRLVRVFGCFVRELTMRTLGEASCELGLGLGVRTYAQSSQDQFFLSL